MSETKSTDFDRPGGYAMPTGAALVQRRAASDLKGAEIRLFGDTVGRHKPKMTTRMEPDFSATDPDTRVYVGDCRDVLVSLPERGEVDLIFADPLTLG